MTRQEREEAFKAFQRGEKIPEHLIPEFANIINSLLTTDFQDVNTISHYLRNNDRHSLELLGEYSGKKMSDLLFPEYYSNGELTPQGKATLVGLQPEKVSLPEESARGDLDKQYQSELDQIQKHFQRDRALTQARPIPPINLQPSNMQMFERQLGQQMGGLENLPPQSREELRHVIASGRPDLVRDYVNNSPNASSLTAEQFKALSDAYSKNTLSQQAQALQALRREAPLETPKVSSLAFDDKAKQDYTTSSTAAQGARRYLTENLPQAFEPYKGDRFSPLTPQFNTSEDEAQNIHQLTKEAALKNLGGHYLEEEMKNDPNHKSIRDRMYDNAQLKEADIEEELKRMGQAGGFDAYMQKEKEKADRIWNKKIAPSIEWGFASNPGAFYSSGRLQTLEKKKADFIKEAEREAEDRYANLRSRSIKDLLGRRQAEQDAYSNYQGYGSKEAQRRLALDQGHRQNQSHHIATQQLTGAQLQAFDTERRNNEQRELDDRRNEFERARKYPFEVANTVLAGAALPQAQLLPPAQHNMAERPNFLQNLGITGSNILAGRPYGSPGMPQGYASGGHVIPQYSDEQLGMNDPLAKEAYDLAHQVGHRPNKGYQAYWSNMASAFAKPGAESYANAVRDSHKAAMDHENDLYNSKGVSSQIINRIHEAKMQQRSLLMNYEREKQKDLWDKAYKDRHLDILEKESQQPGIEKPLSLKDRGTVAKTREDVNESNDLLKLIQEHEQLTGKGKYNKGIISKYLTENPTVLSQVGYGKSSDIERQQELDNVLNAALERNLDQKGLTADTKKALLESHRINSASDTPVELKAKRDAIKRMVKKNKNIATATLGEDSFSEGSFDNVQLDSAIEQTKREIDALKAQMRGPHAA